MKIGVVGCGYVGMSVAINMGLKDYECVCCDIIDKKIENLNNGKLPFYENDLDELFLKSYHHLKFTTNIKDVIDACEIIYIAVATPSMNDGRCNISYLENVIKDINFLSTTKKVLIVKSTCEVGTTEKLCKIVNPNISIIFSPEFLAQGQIKQNILNPQRLVFGLKNKQDEELKKLIKSLYNDEIEKNINIFFTDYNTAELAKYSCNCFLAMKISFINKISQLCNETNSNICDVENIMKQDSRIGDKYLQSGLGFGGSCFTKDLKALATTLQDYSIDNSIIKDILQINYMQINNAFNIITNNAIEKKVLILGTTFKKHTDDLTNSPAIRLIDLLLKSNYCVGIYDCINVVLSRYENNKNVTVEKDFNKAVNEYNDIVICSDWEEFKKIKNFDLKGKNIYDFKQLLLNENINANIFGLGFCKQYCN